MSRLKYRGLVKLLEECGELQQVAAKFIQYSHLSDAEKHPDGTVPRDRMQEEIADVLATIDYVCEAHQLDSAAIQARRDGKLQRFRVWAQGNE